MTWKTWRRPRRGGEWRGGRQSRDTCQGHVIACASHSPTLGGTCRCPSRRASPRRGSKRRRASSHCRGPPPLARRARTRSSRDSPRSRRPSCGRRTRRGKVSRSNKGRRHVLSNQLTWPLGPTGPSPRRRRWPPAPRSRSPPGPTPRAGETAPGADGRLGVGQTQEGEVLPRGLAGAAEGGLGSRAPDGTLARQAHWSRGHSSRQLLGRVLTFVHSCVLGG